MTVDRSHVAANDAERARLRALVNRLSDADLARPMPGGWTVASVLGVTALSLLELFVAFLQAFIFTFLTALFLGSALHPQH